MKALHFGAHLMRATLVLTYITGASLHLFSFTSSCKLHSPVSDSQSLDRLFGAFGPNPIHLCSCGYLGTLLFQNSSCENTIDNGIWAVLATQLILPHFCSQRHCAKLPLRKSAMSVCRKQISVGDNPCFTSKALFSNSVKHRSETDSMLFLWDILLFWYLLHFTVTEER